MIEANLINASHEHGVSELDIDNRTTLAQFFQDLGEEIENYPFDKGNLSTTI